MLPRPCSPAALSVTECLPWGVRCACRVPLTFFFRACCRTTAAAFTTIRVTRDEGLAIIRFSRPDKFNSFIGEQCVRLMQHSRSLFGAPEVSFRFALQVQGGSLRRAQSFVRRVAECILCATSPGCAVSGRTRQRRVGSELLVFLPLADHVLLSCKVVAALITGEGKFYSSGNDMGSQPKGARTDPI